MTLIEVVFLPLYILLLYSSARWGYHRDGWRGVVGGLIAVLVVLPLVGYALGFLWSLIYAGWPPYPACRTGKCDRYQLRRLDYRGYVLCSGCGTRYRMRGRRFYEVQPDGSVRPYMVWRPFRGWFPDD